MLLEANDLIPRFFYRVISSRFIRSLQIGYSLAIVMENVGVRFCGGVESPRLRLAPGVSCLARCSNSRRGAQPCTGLAPGRSAQKGCDRLRKNPMKLRSCERLGWRRPFRSAKFSPTHLPRREGVRQPRETGFFPSCYALPERATTLFSAAPLTVLAAVRYCFDCESTTTKERRV